MDNAKFLDRITIDPQIMVGKPLIKGTRLTVQHILGLLAQNFSVEQILEEYDGLKQEDVIACLLFAKKTLEDNTFVPQSTEK